MDPERWQQVKSLFSAAMERPPDQRATFLERSCGDDTDLRREVDSLLGAHDQADDFIEKLPPVNDLTDMHDALADTLIGQQFGAYRLEEVLGQGGMGAVYRAVRSDAAFEAEVAIKVIRSGFESAEAIRRFHTERQLLADLDHPHIAKLLDGGTSESGIPFLAMELIQGEPIDIYCDRRCLSTAERLALFQQVCSAVASAHRRLVVHRDIKPGNILVTEQGDTKLLDFGIAKLLSPDDVATTEATLVSQRVMTPRFASPEQVRGQAITTATDVYALGVLLYLLLTGHHPYRLEGLTPAEMEKVLCDDEPSKPSTAVGKPWTVQREGSSIVVSPQQIAKHHGGRPAGLKRTLSGDLDRIVLMAMRKQPTLRYPSVEQFSQDIARYLQGLPVLANRRTWSYLTLKFLRRHWFGATAALFIASAVVGGLAGTLWQAHIARNNQAIAEQRFRDVRELANAFLFEFHDSIRDLPGATKTRHLIVKRALQYLERLSSQAVAGASQLDTDRSLQHEIITAYQRVGDIQGNPYFANLGDSAGALTSYRKALTLSEQLVAADPHDQVARQRLALSHRRVADMLAATGDMATARAEYKTARKQYDLLLKQSPGRVELRRDRADSQVVEAELSLYQGEAEAARSLLDQAYPVLTALTHDAPPESPAWRDLEVCHQKMGLVLSAAGDSKQALQHYDQALQIAQRISQQDPLNARARRDVAFGYFRLAGLLATTGQTKNAVAQLKTALEIVRQLAAADLANAQAQRDVSVLLISLGDAKWETGDIEASRIDYAEALEIRQKLLATTPGNAQAVRDVALGFERLGDAESELQHPLESLLAHQQGLQLRRQLLRLDPQDWNVKRSLTYSLTSIAQQHIELAQDADLKPSETRAHWQDALDALRQCTDLWQAIYDHQQTEADQRTELSELGSLVQRCRKALEK